MNAYHEAVGIMQAALTERGGATPGEDGGFLVPVDMQTAINEQRRQLRPLSELFTVEDVTLPTGYRVQDEHPTAGFTKVSEMDSIPLDDQPKFSRIKYAVEEYALIVPASNDLLSDNTAALLTYLVRWFAKKGAITENALLVSPITALTPVPITAGNKIGGIKTILNKTLDPSISLASKILTN